MILHYATRTNDHIYRWTNQEQLKSPNCKLCDQIENINHLFIQCKKKLKNLETLPKILQMLDKKRIHTIATLINTFSHIITIRNEETSLNSYHNNTNSHMEKIKSTTI